LAGAAAVPGFDYCSMASRGHCKTVVRNVWGWELHGWYCATRLARGVGGVGDAEIGRCHTGTYEKRQMVSQGPSQFSAYIPLVLGFVSAAAPTQPEITSSVRRHSFLQHNKILSYLFL